MKQLVIILFFFITSIGIKAQVVKDYNPSRQKTSHIQYFKPVEEHLFTGDCMPYYYNDTFYLYWLLDEGHHSGLGGLGGHQWALSTSKDLITWTHYPVAVGIDEEWEKSICTGSVIAEKDTFYAFYSTRVKEDDNVHEQLSYAISTDGGKTYVKQQPNPFYYAPKECVSRDFRDPKVFKDEKGIFHLFISGYLKNPDLDGFGGYLVHLTSQDLKNWKEEESPLSGQVSTPECSDYFKWNDWYYLLYSINGDTYYVKSKQPYGPWEYPSTQALVETWASVYKTAGFKDDRRIAVAYMPYRKDNKDNEHAIWGGNALLREIYQEPDGTLYSKFLSEVLPAMKLIPTPGFEISSTNKEIDISKGELAIDTPNGTAVAGLSGLPANYRITMDIEPAGNYDELGLFVRATDTHKKGYKIELNANKESIFIHNTGINGVKGLRRPFVLDILVKNEFIDVCFNNQRCIINRLSEEKGKNIFFFLKNGSAVIRNIKVQEITD